MSTNGKGRYQEEKVRVAIIGVGNCASSLVQGVQFYKDADAAESVPGLMHVDLGGYHVRDIEFTAAFDIDAEKVGKDLSEAIWAGQNNTIRFVEEDIPHLGVPVQRGMTHDGLGKYLTEKITKAEGSTVEPGAFVIFCERYLPRPSCVIPRWTSTPSLGTSPAKFSVLF